MSGRRSDLMAVGGILGGAAVGAAATLLFSQPAAHVADAHLDYECRVEVEAPRVVVWNKKGDDLVRLNSDVDLHEIKTNVVVSKNVVRLHRDGEDREAVFSVSQPEGLGKTIEIRTSDGGDIRVDRLTDGEGDAHVTVTRNGNTGSGNSWVVVGHDEHEMRHECSEAVRVNVQEITERAVERAEFDRDRVRQEIERAREQVERQREEMERVRERVERSRERTDLMESAQVADRMEEVMRLLELEGKTLELNLDENLERTLREVEVRLEEELGKKRRKRREGGGGR